MKLKRLQSITILNLVLMYLLVVYITIYIVGVNFSSDWANIFTCLNVSSNMSKGKKTVNNYYLFLRLYFTKASIFYNGIVLVLYSSIA